MSTDTPTAEEQALRAQEDADRAYRRADAAETAYNRLGAAIKALTELGEATFDRLAAVGPRHDITLRELTGALTRFRAVADLARTEADKAADKADTLRRVAEASS
jgi:hypothetical protein